MFSSLDLSPMLILLLLMYGLLIAFSLFAWSALNLRQRARKAGQEPEQQPAQRPAPEVQVRVRNPQEDQGAQQKPWLRTPDLKPESATPRVSAPVYVHPERLPVTRLVAREPAFSEPKPVVQPEPKPAVRSEPAQPPPVSAPEAATPETAGRTRNEDAFERFLRSSRNDPED